MSKFGRKLLVLLALAMATVPLAATAAGAQVVPDTTITVRKVVTGTGTGPSSVDVECTNLEAENPPVSLGVVSFDAQGVPTTVSPADSGFAIVDGAWVLTGASNFSSECTFTETATGGATSTSWTCAYDFEPVEVPSSAQIEQAGCAAASGAGVGPATVIYPNNNEVADQASTVVFTNVFTPTPTPTPEPAAALTIRPAFTG